MKTLWEMDAGGGGGVGGYETDEDEFLGVGCDSPEDDKNRSTSFQTSTSVQAPVPARGAVKSRNTAKKSSMPKNKNKGYHLAYLNLWWNRMAREAKKEESEMREKMEKSKMQEYLQRGSFQRRTQRVSYEMNDCSMERGNISTVVYDDLKQSSTTQNLEGGYNSVGPGDVGQRVRREVLSVNVPEIKECSQADNLNMQVLDNTCGDRSLDQTNFTTTTDARQDHDERESDPN